MYRLDFWLFIFDFFVDKQELLPMYVPKDWKDYNNVVERVMRCPLVQLVGAVLRLKFQQPRSIKLLIS